ncbi:hypothetical protein [Cryobacterium sp. BB736]|uniref:hypothetical protein n=1 Tax=Cryobacterium sp. BB736 TaxID=2746963 RepID=UPI0018767A31|nr:hypothetical protein [Cryobacterium sp. BB736]
MEWKPEDLAAFLNATAPSLTGGLLALAGVVLLFFLQQSAVRRSEQRDRLEAAAERLMETMSAARLAYTTKKPPTSADVQDMLVKSWRFAWLLKKRERPVADWAWEMLWTVLRETKGSSAERDAELIKMFATVMTRLNDWRVKSKKVSWFKKDLERLKLEAAGQ